MKLIYSLTVLLFTFNAFASQIIIYYSKQNQRKNALGVSEIFSEEYQVPISLITTRYVKSCKSYDKRFLELCILENEELRELSNKNQEEIIQSLLIFSKTTEVIYDN